MNKFLILFKKEIQSLINVQTIVPLVLIFALFSLLGNVLGGIMNDDEIFIEEAVSGELGTAAPVVVSRNSVVGFIDNDNSEYSNIIKDELEAMNILALPNSNDPETAMRELEDYDFHGEKIGVGSLIVINQGFENSLKNGNHTAVDVYSSLDSFSLTSVMAGVGGHAAAAMINGIISQRLLIDAEISENIYFLTSPVYPVEHTYLNNTTEKINAGLVLNYVSSQITFIPIIIFLIILMASQMLAMSMVNEKADKTLETLMTVPISRMSVLLAKILSSAVYAAVYAVVYIFALRNFNESMSAGGSFPEDLLPALESFGISFDAATFAVIGVQLFLSVLCGLAIALIIGMMVDDIKTLNSYIMPLMVLIMIPYFLTMFLDVNTLPFIGRLGLYAIPFTHTFTAAMNLFTQNYALLIGGLVYQAVFVAVMLTIAVKIFNSDKLFTLGQILLKKPKQQKKGAG
ncbi:MAG: ABC transporter permease [Oscillospiraceae bacterium]|nr:ABC transporter permease [Oscillospiraceae bacterium]